MSDFIVTKTNNLKDKRKIAKVFSYPGRKLTIKEVECYGCTEIGKKILKGCDVCKIRICAIKKKIKNADSVKNTCASVWITHYLEHGSSVHASG